VTYDLLRVKYDSLVTVSLCLCLCLFLSLPLFLSPSISRSVSHSVSQACRLATNNVEALYIHNLHLLTGNRSATTRLNAAPPPPFPPTPPLTLACKGINKRAVPPGLVRV